MARARVNCLRLEHLERTRVEAEMFVWVLTSIVLNELISFVVLAAGV